MTTRHSRLIKFKKMEVKEYLIPRNNHANIEYIILLKEMSGI
jgi:hypothetical protein